MGDVNFSHLCHKDILVQLNQTGDYIFGSFNFVSGRFQRLALREYTQLIKPLNVDLEQEIGCNKDVISIPFDCVRWDQMLKLVCIRPVSVRQPHLEGRSI